MDSGSSLLTRCLGLAHRPHCTLLVRAAESGKKLDRRTADRGPQEHSSPEPGTDDWELPLRALAAASRLPVPGTPLAIELKLAVPEYLDGSTPRLVGRLMRPGGLTMSYAFPMPPNRLRQLMLPRRIGGCLTGVAGRSRRRQLFRCCPRSPAGMRPVRPRARQISASGRTDF